MPLRLLPLIILREEAGGSAEAEVAAAGLAESKASFLVAQTLLFFFE
jgi:hypothetical protein